MFKTILLPIDLGEESSWAKALPAALVHVRSNGGSLNLVSVVPSFGEAMVATYFPADFDERALAQAKMDLEAFRAAHVPQDIPIKLLVRRGGAIYDEILGVADEIGADLIVVASHRPALKNYLIGPNAARVVRHAGCSVLVVRD